MSLADQLTRMRTQFPILGRLNQAKITLFFSISDGQDRARTFIINNTDFNTAWLQGISELENIQKLQNLISPWIRIEAIHAVTQLSLAHYEQQLTKVKRNYSRKGISFDSEFKLAITEQELNANALLYNGNTVPHAKINKTNFKSFFNWRFPNTILPNLDDKNLQLYAFTTIGIFDDGSNTYQLEEHGRNTGYRKISNFNKPLIYDLISTSSAYLAGEVNEAGQFTYGHFPCFGRNIKFYNNLRHASSTYAMIEAYELNPKPELKGAIERSIDYLTTKLIQTKQLSTGASAAFLVEDDDEIKLGGNAVCILALTQYSIVFNDNNHVSLMEQLAVGIESMQDKMTGKFIHVLNSNDLSIKEEFRIIYYDGEAAFSLMKLYGLTKNERWLNTVTKAFEYFIEAEHWRAHDHWLSYCVNELTLYKPEERYFKFGLSNVREHLDFVLNRITTFPTLLELMMAAQKMLVRLEASVKFRYLLDDFDIEKFYLALHSRARYLLNGYFWPEMAMFFKYPNSIVGSFFIRHHSFRVRIDDVEHYLSGLVAYHNFLSSHSHKSLESNTYDEEINDWTADTVISVTGGQWYIQPPEKWNASGLCIAINTFKPKQLVVIRNGDEDWGISINRLSELSNIAALICSDASGLEQMGLPILKVKSCRNAVIALGKHARNKFQGITFGITGSSGKTTTCSMLAHVLQSFGTVGQTGFSANLPYGVAWNLASIPWDTPNNVIEMAIGKMPLNSSLAHPDIAIITNIGPAHLEYHSSTNEIARKKSAIFNDMADGSHAILNHDMEEFTVFQQAAYNQNLRIVTYGQHKDADIRLIEYNPKKNDVYISIFNQELHYHIGVPGLHMVMNSLAIIAAVTVSGQALTPALKQLSSFQPVDGRGVFSDIQINGIRAQLLDEAYNANPLSMKAMLEMCADINSKGRKVLILGDMLELGEQSENYHKNLLEPLLTVQPDCIILCGPLMKALHQQIPKYITHYWFETALLLKNEILNLIQDQDFIAIKSSHGIGLGKIVNLLNEKAD